VIGTGAQHMFSRSAHVYDAIFGATGEFRARTERVRRIIEERVERPAQTLLDIACGTGAYLVKLRDSFAVEGLDIEPEMLAIASEKCPGVPLHQADLVEFNLGRRFDVVTCLGSSIGYARTLPRLEQAARTFARHTKPGGLATSNRGSAPTSGKMAASPPTYTSDPTSKSLGCTSAVDPTAFRHSTSTTSLDGAKASNHSSSITNSDCSPSKNIRKHSVGPDSTPRMTRLGSWVEDSLLVCADSGVASDSEV